MIREKQPLEDELPNDLLHLIEKRVGPRRDEVSETTINSPADEKRGNEVGRRQSD